MFFVLDPKRLEPASQTREWLGRIVKFYDRPGDKFTPSLPFDVLKEHIKISRLKDVEQTVKASKSHVIKATVAKIASLSLSGNVEASMFFRTSTVLTVRLENYDILFDKAKTRPDVSGRLRQLLPKAQGPAYMIVALLIWTDASFEIGDQAEGSKTASTTLPTSKAAASAGLPVSADAGDIEITLDSSGNLTVDGKGFSPGSSIFAFEYKLVQRTLPAYLRGFDATVRDRGPRFNADKVFSGDHAIKAAEGDKDDEDFELGSADVYWPDLVTDVQFNEETINDVTLVYQADAA